MAWTLMHLMAIISIMSKRWRPHTVISANGTNFVGAARQFKECFNEWNRDSMCKQPARRQLVGKINPPGDPRFGGIWERLVRSCKKAMFAIPGNRQLMLPVLATTKCLVEQTLSAGPVTPVSDDPEDLEALTPNDYLLGRPVVAELLMPDSVRYVHCRKMYKVAQAYNQIIWIKWVKKYLPMWVECAE